MVSDFATRWSNLRHDPWVIPLAVLCLVCFAPFVAQLFGWWHATAAQREVTPFLGTAATLLLLGCGALFGVNRWRGRATVAHRAMLAIAGLAVAEGIIGVIAGGGVLLGALLAPPAAFPTMQVALNTLFMIVWFARLCVGSARLVL